MPEAAFYAGAHLDLKRQNSSFSRNTMSPNSPTVSSPVVTDLLTCSNQPFLAANSPAVPGMLTHLDQPSLARGRNLSTTAEQTKPVHSLTDTASLGAELGPGSVTKEKAGPEGLTASSGEEHSPGSLTEEKTEPEELTASFGEQHSPGSVVDEETRPEALTAQLDVSTSGRVLLRLVSGKFMPFPTIWLNDVAASLMHSKWLLCFGRDKQHLLLALWGLVCTVNSLCNDCFGYQESCPYVQLSLLRGTSAVRMQ